MAIIHGLDGRSPLSSVRLHQEWRALRSSVSTSSRDDSTDNVSEVATCTFGAGQPGIQKSAEWLRTAFHDAATHDSATKTGGLDGSIQYELERRENLGAALNNTLADISSEVGIYSSAADLISLAMVMAVARCGDLHVPLRLGRKDATEAGIMGVPEAHTDLETSRKRFEIAGFTSSTFHILNSESSLLTFPS